VQHGSVGGTAPAGPFAGATGAAGRWIVLAEDLERAPAGPYGRPARRRSEPQRVPWRLAELLIRVGRQHLGDDLVDDPTAKTRR
jgi:hypothetical protein